MPSRRVARGQSWNTLRHSEVSGGSDEDAYSDVSMGGESDRASEQSTTESPTFPTVGAVHRALHPLQATADRVGRQVERFAENLDRLGLKNHQKGPKDCRHVVPLINAYKKIASDTVQHLGNMHAPERQQQLSGKARGSLRNSSAKSTPGPVAAEDGKDGGMRTTVEDLKRWEQEEQTWDLLGLMLQVEYPALDHAESSPVNGQTFVRPSSNPDLHHYSSEKDVWDNFLASDNQAWERYTVVEWLKKCADQSGPDIEQVVEALESGADRGSGLWAHSWLFSKEAIKGQKRLRSWPKALEPDDPGLDVSLLNSEKTKALVTQLDPDAITRQGRALEQQDYYFERAIWLACWEMVRRGKDWDYVREWCQERVEGWRAISMRGNPRSSHFRKSPSASWQSRALWRSACVLTAKDGGINEYENAVYGVLSGYLPSVKKVSHSWDDYLFAHYNSYLLHSFDRHIKQNFAGRVPSSLAYKDGSFHFSVLGGERAQSGNQIVEKMKHLDAIKEEAKEPFKMLQGNLIAKTFDDFVVKHGLRLAQAANDGVISKIIDPIDDMTLEGSVTAPISMADHDFLRLITHIIFIFQDLSYDFGEGTPRRAMESIVVAYIDYLSKAGKQQLLPLYASRLSVDRSLICLGRQLPTILDRSERQTMIHLMMRYGIDVPGVLNTQLQMIILDSPPKHDMSTRYPNLRILEPTGEDPSRLRPIRTGFIGNEMTDDQQDLIHGYEWYLLLDGHWGQTMAVGSIIYKHLLRCHGLAAARVLSRTVTLSEISLGKTKAILGEPIDISKNADSTDEEEDISTSSRVKKLFPARRHRGRPSLSAQRAISDHELLLDQASAVRDFENLFAVLDAMEEWKHLADENTNLPTGRQPDKPWKEGFHDAYRQVETGIQPLLHNWLQNPKDDAEAEELAQIRVACLPEIILAYNTVLDFSSRLVSRDLLLKSMDLAARIASEKSDLGACFVAAGRMPELVNSFAAVSKSIVLADEKGVKHGKSKKKRYGETLDLWTVKAPSN